MFKVFKSDSYAIRTPGDYGGVSVSVHRFSLLSLVFFGCTLLSLKTPAVVLEQEREQTVTKAYQVPAYERVPGVAGKISSVGSDTLANLMTFWSQEFKTLYPQVGFQIQAFGFRL